MSKKSVSLLLVVVMVLGLFSITALAKKSNDSIATKVETLSSASSNGTADAVVMVYGKAIADAIYKTDKSFDGFVAALKSELQSILAGEKLPELEMYLVSADGNEYRLTENAVKNPSFLSSLHYHSSSSIGSPETIVNFIKSLFGWLANDLDKNGMFYRSYGVKDIPQGDYTLEVRSISGDGYTLWQPESGQCSVTVGNSGVNYIGYEQEVGSRSIDFGLFKRDVSFTLPGVFLNTAEPGFGFKSADLGGNSLEGTEFVIVNRDEVEKIVKASVKLGKDTFTNAMQLVGTDGFTWDELSVLNKDLLVWDQDAQQISFNEKQAFKLLCTYWALVEASSKMPIADFMSAETDIRLPAILRASSDSDGYVTFNEDRNITLVWSLEILFDMGNIVLENAEDMELSEGDLDNPEVEAIVNLVLAVAKYSAELGAKFWDDNGQLIEDSINDWIYPILQNDDAASFAKDTLSQVMGSGKMSPEAENILNMLPTHAILTAKMPAGHYIMFETEVPDGYVRSPLFYTINMQWLTDSSDVRNWCYVTVGNLGIILPYYAEDFYTYLRENSCVKNVDKIISTLTGGSKENLVENILNGDTDVTALAIAYNADLIYNYMGGNKLYSSEEELITALNEYLYANGRTKQNMLIFANNVAQAAKSVVTSEINYSWTFYNYSSSLRTNMALKNQALIRGIANSIDTSGTSPINSAIQSGLNLVADNIDTENHISGITDAIQDKAEDAAKDAGKAVLKGAVKAGKTIIEWGLGK